MAATVGELCHREVFTVPATMPARDVLDALARMRIHGAPVIKGAEAVGVITVGDLTGDLTDATTEDRMTQPAIAILPDTPIARAAHAMADHHLHHLVVSEGGRVVGFLSALDIVRGFLGRPPRRPAELPRTLDDLGLAWSDDVELDAAHVNAAPEFAGVIVLVHGGAFREERAVWVEEADDIRRRLETLLCAPHRRPDPLRPWFDWGRLRFRYAKADAAARRNALRALSRLAGEGHTK